VTASIVAPFPTSSSPCRDAFVTICGLSGVDGIGDGGQVQLVDFDHGEVG
jgi:hypothetical protein